MEDRIRYFLGIGSSGGISWSPDEHGFAFVYDSVGYPQVFTSDIERRWPSRRTFSDNRCTNPRFLTDGSILYSSDFGGDENFQLYAVDPSNRIHRLTDHPKSKFLINTVTKQHVYVSANVKDPRLFGIYRWKIPLTEHSMEEVWIPEEGLVRMGCVDFEEKRAVIVRPFSNMHTSLHLLNMKTHEMVDLTAAFSESLWSPVKFLDAEHILVVTDYGNEFRRFGILGLNGVFKAIDHDEHHDITSVEWSYDNDLVYFSENWDGYDRLFVREITVETYGQKKEIDLPQAGVILSGDARSYTKALSLSPSGKKLGMTLSSPTLPASIFMFDLEEEKWTRLTFPSTAGLNPQFFVNPTLERFLSFDGQEIPYFKFLPPSNKPSNGFPAILMIHGGPEAQFRPSFNPIVQFYVSAGYAVIAPNIRGSSGYGKGYLNADNKEKRLDAIRDIAELALYLKENDQDIDGERLVIYGGSYGGFAVLSAMTEYPDLWKAGVDIVGISNFVTFLENTAKWRRKLRESEYGSLEEDYDLLVNISPIHKVDKIQAPLFIIQGDNDERVPLSESIQIYEALKKRGIEVQLMRFDDEGHGVVKLKNKLKVYPTVLEWLNSIV